MKRILPSLIILLFAFSNLWSQRYQSEIYTSYQKLKDSVYAQNYELFPATYSLVDLKCDIYLPPTTDTVQARPLIIFLHTGNFLPKYINQGPTGKKDDSATIEICKRLAMRGFVVCAPAYRMGWNPYGTTVDIRRGTIMQAVYRGMQDAKAAARYMRKNASVFKVDTNKVVMCGQGTGAYIALGCGYMGRNAEARYIKFIDGGGKPYIDTADLGDINGVLPATHNNVNNPGYSSNINMVVDLGGCIGDTSWMEAGEVPVVGFHVYSDPFAPDSSGMVYVPGTVPQPVIPADGNRNICRRANLLGLNNQMKLAHFTDGYTAAAKVNNQGIEGYYRFYVAPGGPQSAPWEWWDSTTVVAVGTQTYILGLGYTPAAALAAAQQCHANGLATNPLMSKTKALAYIDTILNYLSPRMMVNLQLPGYTQWMGISKPKGTAKFSVFPNPTQNHITISTEETIQSVQLFDLSGRTVFTGTSNELDLNLSGGIYLVKVTTDKGEAIQKLVIQ